ncbi:MAG: glycosyltransferase [Anaerovoracaceae bacterium]
MKICCFCEIWGTGGIESFILNMLENIDRSDLKVDIVVEKKISDLYMPRVEAMGLGFWVLSGSTRRIKKNLVLFKELLKRQKYDIVHLNIFQAVSMLYANVAMHAGVPVRIAHAHGSGLRPSFTRNIKLLLHWVSKNTLDKSITMFLACSHKAANFMFPKERDYLLIPNGINIERFGFNPAVRDKIRMKLGIENNFVIGNIGRLSPEKNQSFLLDIMVYLRNKCPETVLLLIGEGDDRNLLEEKAAKLGLLNNVIFYGTTENVQELLWAMDVFVLPSYVEGFGIAAIEAQAASLPVFCSTGVPLDAGITELTEFLPLNAGAEFWADHLLTRMETERTENSEIDNLSEYDIKNTAKKIKALYIAGCQT